MIENSNECKKIFAERLKKVREERGLTQKNFIEGLSINASTLSAYEQAKSNPSMEAIAEIALKYHLSVDWLLGLTDNPENKIAVEEQKENKLETLADIGSMIIALVNTEIAKNCADMTNDTYGNNKNKIDVKLSVSNLKETVRRKATKDCVITFRSQSDEFNEYFETVYKLKDLIDMGTIPQSVLDNWWVTIEDKLKNFQISDLLNDDLPF